MCGICGIFGFNRELEINHDDIHRMTEAIRHRGPDNGGFYSEGNAVLGHRRLSIIDLDTGNQPMSNEDKTLWIVFNGEIYNYRALMSDLEPRHKFSSRSDTEVILHLYEDLGLDALKKLRGMFAFAIFDRKRNLLFLARDRLGKKPLYYAFAGDKLIFASEIISFDNLTVAICFPLG